MKKCFTEAQIIGVLNEAAAGKKVVELFANTVTATRRFATERRNSVA